MFRKENGVTLVALVITIIVLLILAGVTIAMVFDEGGIVAQAQTAQTEQEEAAVMDNAVSAMAAAAAKYYAMSATDKAATTPTAEFVKVLNTMSVFNNDAVEKTEGVELTTDGTAKFLIKIDGFTVEDVVKQ